MVDYFMNFVPAVKKFGSKSRDVKRTLLAADRARDSKNWEEAARLYRSYLDRVPQDAAIWTQFGHATKESGDLTGGEAAYRRGLECSNDDPELYLQLGHILKLQGRFSAALDAYDKSVSIDGNVDATREADFLRSRISDSTLHDADGQTAGRAKAGGKTTGVGNREALLAAGDRARDDKKWLLAAEKYRAYLDLNPKDQPIWIQLGNALKEASLFTESELSYLNGLSISAENNDLYLQLGHVLKLQGRISEAARAYSRSFLLKNSRASFNELVQLGQKPDVESLRTNCEVRSPSTFIEISDFLSVMGRTGAVSGIQRVQLGLVAFIVSHSTREFCAWHEDSLWRLDKFKLNALLADYRQNGTSLAKRGDLLRDLEDSSELIHPRAGDVVITTGVIYFRPDVALGNWRLKRANVKIGAYIHDFIPLTHPEYVTNEGTLEFAASMMESMLTIDFALTVSEHVASEVRRLRRESGYPEIPVRAVPNAHVLEGGSGAVATWTTKIAFLKDKPFVLSVATMYPHKNHMFLLQVWRLLIEGGFEPPILVCVGKSDGHPNDFTRQVMAAPYISNYIRIIDAPSDAELRALYKACVFTMMPSLVEGWGLPVGESLSFGKLCLASRVASIPEVGGDLVYYTDPYDPRSCAKAVQCLLENDAAKLRQWEARIVAEFRPRSWEQQAADFLQALDELSGGVISPELAATPFSLEPGAVLRSRRVQMPTWPYDRKFGPYNEALSEIAGRLVLEHGWYKPESWGVWMKDTRGTVAFVSKAPPGSPIVLGALLRSTPWAGGNRLRMTVNGKTLPVDIPADWPSVPYKEFLVSAPCVVGPDGAVEFELEIAGPLQTPWWGAERRVYIGLIAITHLDEKLALSPTRKSVMHFVQSAQLRGSAYVLRDDSSTLQALRESLVLKEGFANPVEDKAALFGAFSVLRIPVEGSVGAAIRVAMQFEARRTSRRIRLRCQLDDGTVYETHVDAGETRLVNIIFDGKLAQANSVEVKIEASNFARKIALKWAGASRLDDARSCAELVDAFIRDSAPSAKAERRIAISASLRFVVAGHLGGAYSLAAVNRRLALALAEERPGAVRVEQIETHRVTDIVSLPKAEIGELRKLLAKHSHKEGFEVVISQHWPVLKELPACDCALALFAWEESVVPREIIETFNSLYAGVLATSKTVEKSLIDSGLTIPVRIVGNCPDVSRLLAHGAKARIGAAKHSRVGRPFVFLHVSSCFPRKGVDVLLASYVAAFRKNDAVRMVLKTFPNPHNDIAAEIAAIYEADPLAPQIELISAEYTDDEMVELYTQADAVVLPSRAEGFTLPAVEAMAAGIPLITTAYGGHMDFVSPKNARLVDFDFAYSKSHVRSAGSVWAEPKRADLTAAFREVALGETPESQKRVAEGTRTASAIGDKTAWAKKVIEAATDVIESEKFREPKIAWVSTWRVRCGLAEYSKMLIDAYPNAQENIKVFCDDRTDPDDDGGYRMQRAWRVYDLSSMEMLARSIEEANADVVVIQHHKGLIRWGDLASLLSHPALGAQPVMIALHNVQELPDAGADDRAAVLKSLSHVARVLVHSVHDLNILKGYGLVENVMLFPHGAYSNPGQATPGLRDFGDAPLLGSYGFFLPHKGIRQLVEAFALLREQWPNARLRLVNARHPAQESADEIERCMALAEQLGVGYSVEWINDYLPNEESLRLLQQCDLLVLPYQETLESASGALRIAISSMVPVVVTPLPIFDDAEEAVKRTLGTGSAKLCDGIAETLRSKEDRKKLQSAARQWLDDHDWRHLAARLKGIATALSHR